MPATSVQLQPFARLGCGGNACPHGLDDGARLFNQLRVARIDAAAQVEIVLESNPHVATEQHRLRHPRHLHAADGERTPHALRRQRVHHGEQVAGVGRHTPGNAGAQLDHRRSWNQPLLDELLHEPQVPRVEHLQFRLHLQIAQNTRTLAHVVGGGDVGAIAVAEVEGTAIERGDVRAVQALRAQLDDVPHALFLGDEVGAGGGRVGEAALADADVTAHAAGEVDQNVHLAVTDVPDDFAVVARGHAEFAAVRIAHVNVYDGGPGARRRDGGGGNLLRGNGAVGALGDLGVVASDGAGDDDIGVHRGSSPRARNMIIL